jgi:hypothetical protein
VTRSNVAGLALACALLLAGPAAAEDACAGRGARKLLALTPFDAPIGSLHWSESVTQGQLEQWFGAVHESESIPFSGREEPGMVSVAFAWSFDGVRIETHQFEGHPELWVQSVEVRREALPLRCGVRIGMPLARVREILGAPPRDMTDSDGCFELAEFPDKPADFSGVLASLCVQSDPEGRVTVLRWAPISRC